MDNNGGVLHVVMFPWLAIGHLIPFLELSKCLARKGHRVSLVSTPRNIQRLPKVPPNLSPLLNLVALPLPYVDGLPENAEASTDVPIKKTQHLKKAFDRLESPLTAFLENSIPDWIIYDYASHWLPEIAARLGFPCAYFCLFTAATQVFTGPPPASLNHEDARSTPEDFTVVPSWVPFPSDIVYRPHELLQYFEGAVENVSGVSDVHRFGISFQECEVMALRSRVEFEPEWFSLLDEISGKPVISVGMLPPILEDSEKNEAEEVKWVEISGWLEKQRRESVVYVALGSEATLSREQVNELALGLELSELPFLWVLRKPPGSPEVGWEMLPEGFEERTGSLGVVYTEWVPQVGILAHPSVGGFLTHCGWNSVIEGLGFGRALILLPILNDQGLNARLLEGKKLGLEIPRNERDGSFTRDSVAETVRLVMVDEEGEPLRSKAKEVKVIFGDRDENDRLVDGFVRYLKEHRRQRGGGGSGRGSVIPT